MNKNVKLLVGFVVGLLGGAAAVFIASVLTAAVAMTTQRSSRIPGLFYATPGFEGGALSVSFEPNGAGILVVVLLAGVASALIAQLKAPRAAGVHLSSTP